MKRPLLICMTPVRNEAWILKAFLELTSIWADHIIIADQMSTDGSREIALSFPKVILIDNNTSSYDESSRQKLLIEKAREIDGDKILFGLDADEIFSGNYHETEDWQKILHSKPGDVFWFKWAEVRPDRETYWESEVKYYPWMFHDDGKEPHGNYAKKMHSMRIPYPLDEAQMYYVNDFKVLHFAYINMARLESKMRFYKFVDWELTHKNVISLSRTYVVDKKEPIKVLSKNLITFDVNNGCDIFNLIDLNAKKFWFDDYIIENMGKYPQKKIQFIDIWNKNFLQLYNMKDPRTITSQLIHMYLNRTQKIKNNRIIVFTDSIIRKICQLNQTVRFKR